VIRTLPDQPPDVVKFCSPDPRYAMWVRAELIYASRNAAHGQAWSIEPLVPLMRLRPATGEELARLPPAGRWEAD
jgi:hypothetical protein